ncbi:damage-inducible protein DinB [Flavipsychrobacter stenotrophus]|uniref:Damage-inducible protein DinB n=1 Tax=Flavipsychrobacter stenotrophus TaxID=2077091 RepID=A0A2S7SVH1_9BACT|nr:DinB family protein [Flavipsychrobacter stenotrophus]PQJ10920.1 damage-inducible protein DinB [Flavipsychrobacter stenotrophus]
MNIIPILMKEMANEAVITRKMLSIIPEDKYDWQTHPKSMTIRQLASHIAELPGWAAMGLTTPELDFAATPYTPQPINNNAELLAFFEEKQNQGLAELEKATEEQLLEPWTLRNGEMILAKYQKHEVVRVALDQTTHHRAQLGVYLRLLDVPIPGSYGPSADELGK